MSNETKNDHGELVPSTNQSFLTRKSSLVERGLALIHELNKPQVWVRFGDSLCSGISEGFFDLIDFYFKERYDLKFGVCSCSEETIELARNGAIDIFIILANNFTLDDFEDRMPNSLKLITQLSKKYGIPVIAMAARSLSSDKSISSIINEIKHAANFFFWAPPKTEDFMAAFKQCLQMNSLAGISSNKG